MNSKQSKVYRWSAIPAISLLLGSLLASCVSIEEPVRSAPVRNVSYESADGAELTGYLAQPEGGGPFPAVIMIHEWWGLNEDVTILADALSDEGYLVLAPDALRGELATTVPQAIALNSRTPAEQIAADLDGALAYLRSRPDVDTSRIATMGFCFGGRESMRLGIRSDGLAAVITLYGSGLVTEPSEMGNLGANGPVLGIFGEKDSSIPLREVEAFETGLETIGAEHTITVYPDMGHAFVKSSTFRNGEAAGEAWNQVVVFLEEQLTDPLR